MNDYESEAINASDYITAKRFITKDGVDISPVSVNGVRDDISGEVINNYVDAEINKRLKKYDLTYEELEEFIEKYEPERVI